VTRQVEAEEIFAVDAATAFEAYWKLINWPLALDSILAVNVEYDDGTHQSFDMTVQAPGGVETVRGVRFNDRGRRLELCQFEPPPGFRTMSGAWNFEPIDEHATRVRAERFFELEDPSREATVAAMMGGLLSKNLLAFKSLAEAVRS
jgi:ribosome-associated toxin RatA of RatAB toxin-antitoxin module